MGDEQKENKLKLILVGQPRTGKTAIYNRLLTNTYDANSMSSQTPKNQTKVVSLDTGDVEIDVWDTAGQEVFRTLNKIYYKKAVFVLLVYSINDEKSFEELEKYWINEIKTSCPKYSSKININM